MPYQVEIREEICTLISYISPEKPTDEELKHYLSQVDPTPKGGGLQL